MKSEAGWWATAVMGAAMMCWLTLHGFAWNDYDNEVSGALKSLIDGDFAGFLVQAPAYGGSLVLRAPFASAVAALGGGELAVYRAVSIPCVLALVLLAIALVRRMDRRGRTIGGTALVVGLCVCNPITLRALEIGHPEELLCAAFAIGAVLAAIDARTVLASVLLGLAIATKQWAVLAIGPVLLALPERRILSLAIAGTTTIAVLTPLLLAGSQEALVAGASQTGNVIFVPWQAWWFLGESGHVVIGGNGLPKPDGYRVPPEWLSPLTHPLIAFLVIPLTLTWARVHRAVPRFGGGQILLLLALLFLLRCVLDPWNVVYYALPFVLALLAWEALCRPYRPPVIALCASVAVWVTFEVAPDWLSPDMQCAFFLVWSLPLVAWLVRESFARPTPGRVVRVQAPAPSLQRV